MQRVSEKRTDNLLITRNRQPASAGMDERSNNTISFEYWLVKNLIPSVWEGLFENNNGYVKRLGNLHQFKIRGGQGYVCLLRGEM